MTQKNNPLEMPEPHNLRTEIACKLRAGDHAWFDDRYGTGDQAFDVATLTALDTQLMNVGGNIKAVSVIYLPIIIWSLSPINDFRLPVDALREQVAELFQGDADLCLAEDIKSASDLAQMDPVDVYQMGQHIAASIIEQSPLTDLVPFNPDVDQRPEFGGHTYTGEILAIVVHHSVSSAMSFEVSPLPILSNISTMLSYHFQMTPEYRPMVYVGFPSPRRHFVVNLHLVEAFATLDMIGAAAAAGTIELDLIESSPYALHYSIQIEGQPPLARITVPTYKLEEFNGYLASLSQKHNRQYTFSLAGKSLH